MERMSIAGGTYNNVGGNQFNNTVTGPYNYYFLQSDASNKSTQLRPFIDAPVDILSVHFTGRTDELVRIKEIFENIRGNIPIRCVIYGMHGIGKSQLTLLFAKLAFEKQQYKYVIWISATTVEKLHQGFAKLLDLVDHKDRVHPEQGTRLTAARRWLEESEDKWLLVLDNVECDTLDFLREHLPRQNPRGNMLFTTRTETLADTLASAAGQRHETIELRLPTVEDAAKLLLGHSEGAIDDNEQTSRAKDVVKCVGCLPLAVAQAGSFMRQSGKSLDDLLSLYDSDHKFEMIKWENNLSTYEAKSVAATFSSQLEDLAYQFPTASNLLNVLVFLDPESISLDMIIQGAEVAKSSFIRKVVNKVSRSPDVTSLVGLIHSPVELHKAITQLQNRSLVKHQRVSQISTLYIHDLVQLMVQESIKRSSAGKHWFEFAVQLVSIAFARIEEHTMPENWAQCELFVSHIQSLILRQEMFGGSKTWNLLMAVNDLIVEYLVSRGRYSEGETFMERALAMKEKRFGSQHHDTLATLHLLANIHLFQNRFKEAEALYVRVLAVRKKRPGPEHDDTLETMNKLAFAYTSLHRYSEAEVLHTQILAIRRARLGSEHPKTLRTTGSLANVYNHQGKYSEAESILVRLLAIQHKLLGVGDPDTRKTVSELAIVFHSQGKFNDSKLLYESLLAIEEKDLGAEHPETLKTMGNLAVVYESLDTHNEAEKLYERILAIQVERLGAEHLETLQTRAGLASVYQSRGRHDAAARLHEQVLDSRQKHLGVEHPQTLWSMRSLGVVYHSQGRHSDAAKLFENVLAVEEKHLGVEHPDTRESMNNLSRIYEAQGRVTEAEQMRERAASPS